ncbi:TPM domain-containing protein [Paenibacillus sp. FSL R5-0713]|uniref:TPM domain-containing protein n=1 Tax=Paenibacillus sp. FSL R5-0713 TaxID=2921655 RepID=UPI0030DD2A6D
MRKRTPLVVVMATLILLMVTLVAPLVPMSSASAAESKNLIYDEANLLSEQDKVELNALANQYGAERQTDFVIYTSNNEEHKSEILLTEDFYDDQGFGYDKKHGNAVILTIDMYNRKMYLAGFYKGEEYIDNGRADKITAKIAPDVSDGNYRLAFEKYLELSYEYMDLKPGVNPDNILFNTWFQLAVSVAIGGIVVGVMTYRSGGRVTVNRATYEDSSNSSVIDRQDRYIRTTVTKRKIEKNNNNGGGGGGGGTTRGGHSHSGSSRSF